METWHLARTDEEEPPRPPRPTVPVRRFVGSSSYFVVATAIGVVAGIVAAALVTDVRSGGDVSWTERAMTWLGMLFGILGGLAGATCALVVESVVRRLRR